MKEKISRFSKLLFTIFYAIYFIVSPAVGVIAAEPQKGEVRNGNETASKGDVSVNKKVEPVAGQEGYYDITFTVKGKKYTDSTTVPTYTVFVVDASNSMDGTPWRNAKNAAIAASKTIIDASSESKVALVTFGLDASIEKGFSHSYLTNSDFGNLKGLTNYDAGLMRALELLNSVTEENAVKNVVFISDGEPRVGLGNIASAPNSFDITTWNGPFSQKTTTYYTQSEISPYKFVSDAYSYLDSSSQTTYLMGHKRNVNNTAEPYKSYNYTRNNTLSKVKGKLTGENENIYSVSYNISDRTYQENLRTISTNGNYYNTDSDGIGQILADVATKISTTYAGEDATLTDNMGADFDVQTSSGFDVVGDDALSVHIDKLDDETRTFTIRVKIDPYASTGWHKTNDGFTLTYTDENGNEQTITPENDPEVYWVAAKGKVTANYYIDGTTTKLADSVVQINDVSTNGVRNTYETSSKDIYGYTLKSVDGEETGYYTIEDQEVNYYYTKNDITVIDDETSIEKTGDATETHKKVTDAFNYQINYETKTDDYIGDATVTITDTLPYEVDLSKTNDFAGGTYNQENKTITWTVTKNVSEPTTENPDANKIKFNKNITVYYKNITDYNVVNNVKAQIANNTKEDSHSNIVDGTHVYVKYIDKSTGAALIPQKDLGEKLPGTSYSTTPETIYGYTVVSETPENYEGTYANDDITVVYEYNKNQGDVKNQNISKTAPAKLDSVNNYIEYTINYSATVDEFVGTATTILKDTPIYKVDTSKANDFGDGVYDEETNTITWTLTNENPLSEENKAVSYNRTIKVYYILDDSFDGTIVNNVNGKTQNSETVEASAPTTIDKGKVITKFVEEGTTTEIAQRVEEEDYYGRTTDTNAIDIYGYTLVTDPSATKETFGEEEVVVIYEYSKNPIEVDDDQTSLEKTGDDSSVKKNVDDAFNYEINYETVVVNSLGEATVTITDTLPYEVDASKSDFGDGEYDPSTNTITWEVTKNITKTDNKIEFNDSITIYYKNITGYDVVNEVKAEIADNTKTDSHTNKVNGSNVYVKYVEEGTTNELKETKDLGTKLPGESYSTEPEDIYGYTVVNEKPDKYKGEYAVDDITVVYEYSKNPGEVTEETLEKTGDEEAVNKDGIFTYDINYNATIDDFAGTVTTTVTDTLPYAIDESASDLQGGTYDSSNKTITWTFDTEINEDNQDIEFTKTIKVKYVGVDKNKVKNEVNTVTAYDEKTTEKTDDYETDVKDGTITVRWIEVDKDGNEVKTLKDDSTTTGLVGDTLDTKADDFYGYTLLNEESETTETYAEKPQTVEYKYIRNAGDVTGDITKTGPATSDSINDPVTYDVEYTGKVDDFVGTATTIIKDSPLYKIDVTKSSLDGGEYDEATNTITWTHNKEITKDDNELSYKHTITLYYLINADEFDGDITNTATSSTTTDTQTKPAEEQTDEVTTTVGKGTVVTKFVEEGTTKEIAESVTDTGYYGDTVETKAIDVYGYTLVTSPDTTTETFAKEEKTVVYEYSKNPGDVTEEEISKEGSDTPVGKDELFTYDLSYNATIDDFAGTVTTTVTDTLPYAIDESASDLAGGNYNSAKNTITWTFDTEINEDNQDIEFTKTIKVKYVGVDKNKVKNTLKGETTYDDNKTKKETSEETEVKEGTITVRWIEVDKDGEEIAPLKDDSKTTGLVGDTRDTKAEKFFGYTLLSDIPEEITATYKEEPTYVVYRYTKNPGDVTNSEVTKIGDSEAVSKNKEFTYTLTYKKTIDNFVGETHTAIIDTLPGKIDLSKSNLAGGEYDEENNNIIWDFDTVLDENHHDINFTKTITVVFTDINSDTITNKMHGVTVYDDERTTGDSEYTTEVKKSTIIVKYIDEEGNEIAESYSSTDLVGNTGTFNAKTIEGYTLKTPASGSITTTYEEETKTIVFIYTKNLPPKEEGIVPPQTGLDGVKYYGIYSIKYLVLLILVAARLKFKRA